MSQSTSGSFAVASRILAGTPDLTPPHRAGCGWIGGVDAGLGFCGLDDGPQYVD